MIASGSPAGISLLGALRPLLTSHRPAFRQARPFLRMQALLLGNLFSFARRTVTQALVSLGLTDHEWSSFYRLFNEPRVDYEELTGCFLSETLENMPDTEPGPGGAVAGLGLRHSCARRLPRLGARKRPDPSSGAMVERLRKVVFEHVVARLPG